MSLSGDEPRCVRPDQDISAPQGLNLVSHVFWRPSFCPRKSVSQGEFRGNCQSIAVSLAHTREIPKRRPFPGPFAILYGSTASSKTVPLLCTPLRST